MHDGYYGQDINDWLPACQIVDMISDKRGNESTPLHLLLSSPTTTTTPNTASMSLPSVTPNTCAFMVFMPYPLCHLCAQEIRQWHRLHGLGISHATCLHAMDWDMNRAFFPLPPLSPVWPQQASSYQNVPPLLASPSHTLVCIFVRGGGSVVLSSGGHGKQQGRSKYYPPHSFSFIHGRGNLM